MSQKGTSRTVAGRTINMPELIALVVSSCIGTGIFGITNDLSRATAPGPALIGWGIAGAGFLMLILSINHLTFAHPEMSSGIFAYAGAFGPFAEFISGWSYWLSAWLGNIAFCTMLMSALGHFFPVFAGGQNLPSILLSIAIIWIITVLIIHGVEEASFLNMIGTICKVVPLILFVIIVAISFKADLFSSVFWGNVSSSLTAGTVTGSVWTQVQGALMTMIWVFIGVEGANVLLSRAKSHRATVVSAIVSFALVWIFYVLISILPYGVFSRAQLARMNQPALGGVLEHIVGPWGSALINIGLIISSLFALLSWTILPTESMRLLANDGVLSSMWGKVNKHGAPTQSLIVTTVLETIFLFSLLFTTHAYEFAYGLCTAAVLYSYLFVGLFQMRCARQEKAWGQFVIGVLAFAFQLGCMILAGWREVLVVTISFLIGFILYVYGRKQHGKKITAGEIVWMVILGALGILAIVLCAIGVIQLG
jgi:arginine:ornithine antiporter/lysine permease